MANTQILSYRRSPAQDFAAAMEAGSAEAVSLREVPFQTQLSIRAELDSPAARAVEGLLGAPLPRQAGHVVSVNTPTPGHVLWVGPDDFLYVAADEAITGLTPAAVADQFTEAIGTAPGQAVDLTGNRTVLELTGPAVPDVLRKMTDVDVHPDYFRPATAIATLLASAGVIIWRKGPQSWWIMPRSSFAPHVVSWLLDGMREFIS